MRDEIGEPWTGAGEKRLAELSPARQCIGARKIDGEGGGCRPCIINVKLTNHRFSLPQAIACPLCRVLLVVIVAVATTDPP